MKTILMKSLAGMEFGAMPLDVKTVADDGTFEGYASVFGEMDLGRDIVVKGAFLESLKVRGPRSVKLLWNHDQADPIGVLNDLGEDDRGLRTKGRLLIETQRGKDVHAMVKAGAVDGLSMGYRTVKSRFDSKANARLLDRVDLWEISIVTIPMLQSARVDAVKSFNPRELEGALRDAGLSRSDAVMAVGVFRKSLRGDAGEPEEGQREAGSDLLATMRRFTEKMTRTA